MLYHQGTKILESENIALRPFYKGDGKEMFHHWASDPKTVNCLLWDLYESQEQAEKRVSQWVAQYDEENFYHWAILLKESNAPIGSISVARQDDLCETAEIGYCIGSAWWGEGYTTEALGLVINYLFGEVGYHRIEAKHAVENIGSHKVQLKNGMLQEGVLKGGYKNKDGSFSDLIITGMTREDWEVM